MATLLATTVMGTYSVTEMTRSHTSNRTQFRILSGNNLTIGSGDRKLDDAELDSGDDEGRLDRIADTIEENEDDGEPTEEQVVQIYPTDIGRMAEPELSDGNVGSQESAANS
jgi:hypothetical protein